MNHPDRRPAPWPLYLESPQRRLDAARRQSELERRWFSSERRIEPWWTFDRPTPPAAR